MDFDVVIIGAGLSGIGTACHLARECPRRSVGILERRQRIGGTWDLFRYPGVRSDSDMGTMGFDFAPWHKPQLLANGTEIREYITGEAQRAGFDRRIRYGLKCTRADWSSATGSWTVTAVDEAGATQRFSCGFLVSCTGYYNYDAGYRPRFPDEERFKGRIVHPQFWPQDLDCAGKSVVVIGSGATAVTLVPALAKSAAHVTMVQRSPSYVFSLPNFDRWAAWFAKVFPAGPVYRLARRRNLMFSRSLYKACRRWPQLMRRFLQWHVRRRVGADFDMRHFTPRYAPWDERLCFVPDDDLFVALREKRATMVTGEIEAFTESGLRMKSGQTIEADVIVTATGLNVQVLGGMEVFVDGEPCVFNQRMTYKAVLLEGVPNFGWIFGYTNATWTLKSDIAGRYLCRLFNHMEETGVDVVVPQARADDVDTTDTGVLESLKSGYVRRGRDLTPRQGRAVPWRVLMNYELDRPMLLDEPVADPVLQFHRRGVAADTASASPTEKALAAPAE
ncbi:MAG TPA: NAD(P)/FAD-dependent oxidoreductase [Burkholderiaceae bacterium]|nr:NAD(P)/FAD-dependent oxidoreductase [Burkholderiaceae bacterium]HQR70787.1 NAD(P)/FAD-dependent oxidoreductase [Burkholderiaceae bacterium]